MEVTVRLPFQLGVALKRRRRELGLTQKKVAELTCLRQATISRLESSEGNVQLDTLLRLLGILDLEMAVRSRNPEDDEKQRAAANASAQT